VYIIIIIIIIITMHRCDHRPIQYRTYGYGSGYVVSNHVVTDKLTTANGGMFTSSSASLSS